MSDEEGLRELLRKARYSEKAIDYYTKKRNVGVIEGAEATESHNGLCGHSMRAHLKIEKDLIIDAKFKLLGVPVHLRQALLLQKLLREGHWKLLKRQGSTK
jgi:NifU-like protein involved in Fe-S cluster formation